MRPRYLEIEGLQSFRDKQKIDFDRLGETGLFGIFGPTGSGKSTVLDAITLALYGEVHRAVSGTQGIINTNLNTVKVSFVFDLLKDNTRKTYRVERVYNKKKGTENSCEAKVARLIEVLETGDMPVADKSKEVTATVEELLGLKHDDFTRAVVLPQNKFQEFLLMKNSDKSKMLERIFYLEEYGKLLTEKVSKKLAATKNKLTGVQGALSQLGDASDKALETAASNMAAAEIDKNKAAEELKELETKYIEAKEVYQLVNELTVVTQREQLHLTSLNVISDKKIILEKAVKAEGLVSFISEYRKTEKALSDTNTQLEAVLVKLPELENQLNDARVNYESILKTAGEDKPRLVERKTRLGSAFEIKKEIDDINVRVVTLRDDFKSIREKISAIDKEFEKDNAEIKNSEANIQEYKSQIGALKVDIDYRNEIQKGVKLEDELNTVKRNVDMQESSCNLLTGKVTTLQQQLELLTQQVQLTKNNLEALQNEQAMHEKSKPGHRDDINAEIERFHNLKVLYSSIKNKSNDIEILRYKVVKAKEALGKSQEGLSASQTLRSKFEAERNVHFQEVETLKKNIEKNTAYMLTKTLSEGNPCPVCGSSHHPSPASQAGHEESKELEQKLEAANAKLTEAEAALRDAENKCIALTEQIKNMEAQYTQCMSTFEEGKKEYDELSFKLPEELKQLDIMRLEKQLESIALQNEKKLKAIGEWEVRLEAIKNNVSKANSQVSVQLVEEKGVKSELQVNLENLNQAEEALKEAAKSYTEINQIYTEFLDKYKIQDAAGELKRITENDRKIETIQKKIEQLQKSIDMTRKIIEILQLERGKLLTTQAEIETDGKNLRIQKEEKEKKVKELAGECDILLEIKNIDEKLLYFSQQEKALSESVKSFEALFNSHITQKTTLENQRDIYSNNLNSEKTRLDNAIAEKGFSDTAEVENSILDKEKQKLLSREIEDYEQIYRNLQAQKSIVVKKLNNRSISEEQWNTVSRSYEIKLSEKETSTSRYEVAKNIYFTTKERHDKWVILNKDCSELGRKFEMLEQIKTLLKGNSFIEYIAEERLRYIAKEASETLGVMTKYRYALELDSENGFVIRDNANGGVHRLISSLSGGETFLTALSLALALSKQIQLKGQSPLEFFFLDEGFGTLDSNLLDTVIDSLERLSTKERVIGLISHVPELRNRISRRLLIDPPSSDGKGSSVRIEKA